MQTISWKIHKHFFKNISLEQVHQILKRKDKSSKNEVAHVNFYEIYTADTPLTFFQKNVCAQRDIIIEDCDVIFIATSIVKMMLTKR